MNIYVLERQSFFDLAVEIYGDATKAFDLAMANDRILTDAISEGTELEVPSLPTQTHRIAQYYAENQLKPANALGGAKKLIPQDGIGTMEIGYSFRVQ